MGAGRTRVMAALAAAIVWAAEISFFASHIRTDSSVLPALWIVLGYLTDWSNLLVAVVLTGVAARSPGAEPCWRCTWCWARW